VVCAVQTKMAMCGKGNGTHRPEPRLERRGRQLGPKQVFNVWSMCGCQRRDNLNVTPRNANSRTRCRSSLHYPQCVVGEIHSRHFPGGIWAWRPMILNRALFFWCQRRFCCGCHGQSRGAWQRYPGIRQIQGAMAESCLVLSDHWRTATESRFSERSYPVALD
jgi:hypothetical protein